jgi:serine/threonine-protein kinase HipA
MTGQDMLEVWLDCELGPAGLVGTLAHNRGQIRFRYERSWLKDARAFALDPNLSLDEHPFFPKPEQGNFGVFLDSSPDRWGQTLMKRREALLAKDEKRAPRTLYAWDFLIGVQDLTRQGALRFRRVGTDEFLGNEKMAAPPVTTLRELEAVAYQLSSRRIDDLDALRKWLAVLVAPGASLGGARPKANFTQTDGSLWIGKFPARDDDRDVGAWEYVVHTLAKRAGVDMPLAKLIRLNNHFHTFCVQRFDRAHGARRFYASAMTLLRKEQTEGTSYLDLAQFIRSHGDAPSMRTPTWSSYFGGSLSTSRLAAETIIYGITVSCSERRGGGLRQPLTSTQTSIRPSTS